MSDRETAPTDLVEAVCRLDDIAEWLEAEGYQDEGGRLHDLSEALKGYIVIRLAPVAPQEEERK